MYNKQYPKSHVDYYGNIIPGRNYLLSGSTGTLENSQEFWQKVLNGEIDLVILLSYEN